MIATRSDHTSLKVRHNNMSPVRGKNDTYALHMPADLRSPVNDFEKSLNIQSFMKSNTFNKSSQLPKTSIKPTELSLTLEKNPLNELHKSIIHQRSRRS